MALLLYIIAVHCVGIGSSRGVGIHLVGLFDV